MLSLAEYWLSTWCSIKNGKTRIVNSPSSGSWCYASLKDTAQGTQRGYWFEVAMWWVVGEKPRITVTVWLSLIVKLLNYRWTSDVVSVWDFHDGVGDRSRQGRGEGPSRSDVTATRLTPSDSEVNISNKSSKRCLCLFHFPSISIVRRGYIITFCTVYTQMFWIYILF